MQCVERHLSNQILERPSLDTSNSENVHLANSGTTVQHAMLNTASLEQGNVG